MENLSEKLWNRQPGALTLARKTARFLKSQNNYVGAHSLMLSTYLSCADSKLKQVLFFLPAFFHAWCLTKKSADLSGNQLDVLIQFWLKIRRATKMIWHSPNLQQGEYSMMDQFLLDLSQLQIEYFEEHEYLPHQRSLAWATHAEVLHEVGFTYETIKHSIQNSLANKEEMRKEEDQALALRQLTRIYRKIGEILCKQGKMELGREYLTGARIHSILELGKSLDQQKKIEASMRRFGIRYN